MDGVRRGQSHFRRTTLADSPTGGCERKNPGESAYEHVLSAARVAVLGAAVRPAVPLGGRLPAAGRGECPAAAPGDRRPSRPARASRRRRIQRLDAGVADGGVAARVRGHIQKIHFQDGDDVRQGQLLIELDPRPFQSAIDECLAQAKALEAKKIAADKNVIRTTELLKRNAISAQEQEQIVADALALDAERKAKLQQAETLKLDLEYSRIVAPISGRISRAMLTEGNLVNAGGSDPVLTTIVCTDPMYIYFNVNERALQRYMKAHRADDGEEAAGGAGVETPLQLRPGHRRRLSLQGNDRLHRQQDRPDHGHDRGPRRRAERPAEFRRRLPRPRPPAGQRPYKATLVRDDCVLTDQDKRYVLVLGKGNVALRRDISPGRLLDDGMRVVLAPPPQVEPLTPTDWIIIRGMQQARENEPVEPRDAAGEKITVAHDGDSPRRHGGHGEEKEQEPQIEHR